MAVVMRMPAVLAGASEASVQTWLVSVGAAVTAGQLIAEVETDKAIVDLPADTSGTVAQLLVAEGASVDVGDPILVLSAPGDDSAALQRALADAGISTESAPNAASVAARPTAAVPAPSATPASRLAPTDEPAVERRLFASPLVRRLAREHGVEVDAVTGTGPNGRIVRRDLERYLAAQAVQTTAPQGDAPVAEDAVDVAVDRMRRTIARRLTESVTTVPHFFLTAHCRVDALLELRRQINAESLRKVSVNDFVLKAVAAAHVEVPEVNATWHDDTIRRYRSVDVGVAVSIEGGLVTPVIRGAHEKSLTQIAEAVADVAERAKVGALRQHELSGGSFTVSNLGMYGAAEFSAIINPPQAGILAVGAARRTPVVTDAGAVEVGTVMTVTLSADHRVIDGALAATWLAVFQRRVESPLSLLI